MRLPIHLEMHGGDKLYEFYLAKSLKVLPGNLFLNILYTIHRWFYIEQWIKTFFQIKIFDVLVALKKLSNNNPLILAAETNTSLQNSLNVNYFSISYGWMSSGSFEKNNTEMTKKYQKMTKTHIFH